LEKLLSKGNNCLDAAKACNLNDTCKRFRSAYITPCTSSTSNEICNKRKCHKALRLFFDKVPPKHSYGMLFCSCRDVACTERRRQTIVPVCSYEDREKPNCLNLQESCTNAELCVRVQHGPGAPWGPWGPPWDRQSRTLQVSSPHPSQGAGRPGAAPGIRHFPGDGLGCRLTGGPGLAEPVAGQGRAVGGTVMTPNYIDSNSLSVAPWCDCSNSGNDIDECLKFLNFFQDNTCLSEYKIRCLKCVLGCFLEFLYCLKGQAQEGKGLLNLEDNVGTRSKSEILAIRI
uniref:GDNF/GAS1 domain-containing protein n=1 Tax=Accipiter nisus TaxID=211598 RepID=A0A8B9M0J4_9AVES